MSQQPDKKADKLKKRTESAIQKADSGKKPKEDGSGTKKKEEKKGKDSEKPKGGPSGSGSGRGPRQPSQGKVSTQDQSKTPDKEENKKGSKKGPKGGSESKGGTRNRKEGQIIGGPSYKVEDADDNDDDDDEKLNNNQQVQLKQLNQLKQQLLDFDEEASVKLETPLRLNMSYKDSKGNRHSGVHSVVASDQPNDLLNGNGLGGNPISERNPNLASPIPVEDSNMLSGTMNGGERADTEEASKLFDENKELKVKNVDLRKKIAKYKKQVELIPELRNELQNMRESLQQVEQGYVASKMKTGQEDDLSFGKNHGPGAVTTAALNPQQLRKLLDRMEEKNYSLVKENIDLKGQISELREQIIKRNNFIEGLRSDIKIMMNDLKYLFTKLNHGQEIPGVQDPGITAKFIVSQIDHLIEQKLTIIKELQEKCYLYEDRMNGLKDQIINLQSMADRNQMMVVQTTAKMTSLEDINKNLQQDVTVKTEVERLQDSFKQHIRNRMLNLRHQIEAISQDTLYASLQGSGPRRVQDFSDLSIEQLMEQIGERSQNSALNERKLRQIVEQLQVELSKKQGQTSVEIQNCEDRYRRQARDDEEKIIRLQEHIKRLEDAVQKTNYEKSYSQVDINARMRAGESQSQQLQEEISILQSFIYNLLKMNKAYNFQKSYLQAESRSAQDSLKKFEYELKSLLPGRDRQFQRPRAIKKLKKVVRAVMFAQKLKKINLQSFGDAYFKKKACERLFDNWANQRYFWDANIMQNVRLHQIADGLLRAFSQKPVRMQEFPHRFFQDEKLEYVDALRVKMGDLETYATQMAQRHNDHRFLQDMQQAQRGNPSTRSLDGRDVQNLLMQEKSASQNMRRQEQLQEDLILRLRQSVRQMESAMEEQRVTNEQKVRYLRHELEVKRHQLDNMRAMVEISDPSMNNIIVTNDLDLPDNTPVRVGGGFLVPSLSKYY